MRAQRVGFISLITVLLTLGWFMNGWSITPSEERESYKKEMSGKLKDLDRKIDELQAKIGQMKGEAKAEYTKEMTELREKEKAAKREWRKVKRATADKWEKAKADMDTAVQDIEGAYDKTVSRLKEHKG